MLNHVEHRNRVRMMQPGGDPSLAHRPKVGQLGVARGQPGLVMQLFQRDTSLQALVPGFPDLTHPPAAHEAHQAISPGDESLGLTHRIPPVSADRAAFEGTTPARVTPDR